MTPGVIMEPFTGFDATEPGWSAKFDVPGSGAKDTKQHNLPHSTFKKYIPPAKNKKAQKRYQARVGSPVDPADTAQKRQRGCAAAPAAPHRPLCRKARRGRRGRRPRQTHRWIRMLRILEVTLPSGVHQVRQQGPRPPACTPHMAHHTPHTTHHRLHTAPHAQGKHPTMVRGQFCSHSTTPYDNKLHNKTVYCTPCITHKNYVSTVFLPFLFD